MRSIHNRKSALLFGSALTTIFISVFCPLEGTTWRGDVLLAQISQVPWQVGIFRIQPQLVLTDLGYDNNLYYQPNAVSDFSLTFGPRINAFIAVKKKLVLAISESPQYVYYLRTSQERTWNNYFSSDLSLILNRIFISFGGYFNNVRQRWSYEFDLRPRMKETGYRGQFLWQPGSKTSFALAFRQSEYRYVNIGTENFGNRLNRIEKRVTGSAYLQLTARTQYFLDLELGRISFITASFRDARSYGIYTGLNFLKAGVISGNFRIGYKAYLPNNTTQISFKGTVGNADIRIVPIRSLLLRISYRRDVSPSMLFDNSFYVENNRGMGLSYYFIKKRFRFDIDFSEILYEYPSQTVFSSGDSTQAVPPMNPEQKISSKSTALYYRLGTQIGLGLRIGQLNRKINIYQWDIDRFFTTLDLTYDF